MRLALLVGVFFFGVGVGAFSWACCPARGLGLAAVAVVAVFAVVVFPPERVSSSVDGNDGFGCGLSAVFWAFGPGKISGRNLRR